ncbi:glycosyltransferase family 4 protein [Spirosoma endophyticum]|uniref:Glycosyltransferase involved in cell wall bisynthesis n=1 Tax=Spirosoma endophyticum TaxID=662367 RepID=A0A1I2D997_9BACT|nr:glycosyltransferase family 1 protein [Spirosoma endophyticum]SFE77106.1 Glycosyltransferase involved in cell wall bisynthesis [Spirosoma endophyticum]
MIRITFDCERMKYANTGLYYYCLNLGKALQQNSTQEQLSVFGPRHIRSAFGPSVPVIPQNSLQKFFMPSLSQFQIWHSTYQSSQYLPRRNSRIKVVLTIHDLNFLHEDKTEQKKKRCLEDVQRNIDRSDAIVCISEFTKNDVLTHCDTGNKPVHMIYNGTNGLETPLLKEKSYRPTIPFLFNIGAIARKKNQHQILPLLQSNPALELVLAGRHEDKDYAHFLKQQASVLKVEDRMHLVDEISEQEKSWYYHNCQAVVMPSLAEGFGLPVTEAMSIGKPVFLSKHTALPEIGKDLAFYFYGFDNMQEDFMAGMRHYKKAGSQMKEAMKAHSATFNWEDSAKKYIEVYRSLA